MMGGRKASGRPRQFLGKKISGNKLGKLEHLNLVISAVKTICDKNKLHKQSVFCERLVFYTFVQTVISCTVESK
jgi:hypothetical protein